MGNAATVLVAITAALWLVWWLTNRHPADQHTTTHQEK